MKKFLFLLVFIPAFAFMGKTQTNVKLMDIGITPVLNIDSLTGLPIDTTVVDINVSFKIKNIDQADKAYFLFGTVQDSSDVFSAQADIINSGGNYYLSYNGNQLAVNNYTAQSIIQLSAQQDADYNYITLYVKDTAGQESSRLYLEK